jgi:hypothetical protein
MEKLARFGILLLLYVISFIVLFTIIPSITWLFGGSFRDVAHCAPYVGFTIVGYNCLLGAIFSECFDTNFKSKR